MKRTFILAVLLALVASLPLSAQSTLSRVYNDLEIDLWTDQDDGSNYTEGDELTIYFSASRDCYVTIFDLDTRGNINLIFPETPDGPNFIEGGTLYELPAPSEDYVYTVSGPPGDEYLQMVASTQPYEVPDWQAPISVYDDYWPFDYNDDTDQFIFNVVSKYFPVEDVAYDQVSFYVAPKYYYKRTYSDCDGDCGTVYIDYPQGCEVYVDGIYWGAAPLWIPSIYLGRHRVSVYWGTSIVYHDWIYVDYYDPFFVYPRSHFIYDYTYRHWYPYRYYDYYYGPSKIKYKKRSYYAYGKPDPKPGYQVVTNSHGKYKKSPTYTNSKTKRLGTYKSKYGYDKGTSTYTSVKKGPSATSGTKTKRTTNSLPPRGSTYTNSKGSSSAGDGWKGYGDDAGVASKGVKTQTKTKAPGDGSKGATGSGKGVDAATPPATVLPTDKYKSDASGSAGWKGQPNSGSKGSSSSQPSSGKGVNGSGTINTKAPSPSSTVKSGTASNPTKGTDRYKSTATVKPKSKSGSVRPSSSGRRSSGSVSKKPSSSSSSSRRGSVSKKPTGSGSRKSGSVSKKPAASPKPKSSSASKKSSGGSKKGGSSGGKKKK